MSSTYDTQRDALKSAVLSSTTAAHALPSASDIGFHATLSADFSRGIDSASSRLLSLTQQLLHFASEGKASGHVTSEDGEALLDEHDFEANVVEHVDGLLELADGFIDEHKSGAQHPQAQTQIQTHSHSQGAGQAGSQEESRPAQQPQVHPVPSSVSFPSSMHELVTECSCLVSRQSKEKLDSHLVYAKHLSKPQLAFDNSQRPANARGQPFKPAHFPHNPIGSHPFAALLADIPDSLPPVLSHDEPPNKSPEPPKSFDETPFVLVDSVSKLESLFKDLKGATEIAMDLEHHDYRTYAGLTCLIQLSIPGKDYVIDTLVPAVRARLHRLNTWTADPAIVKVLHGAKSDVMWLQRDFGVFLVGLFDTFFASKLLGYPHHGLANLLERFCGFAADKRYQMADWRIRPMPQEMLFYARADTHFLLFVFHALLQAINKSQPSYTDAVKAVMDQSNGVAGQVYQHPTYEHSTGLGGYGWRGLLQKWNKHLNYRVPVMPHEYALPTKTGLEFHVFRALHDWRDRVARELDEAPRYILNHHLLFKLAEERPESMTKLRILLGPAVKGKEELVGLIRREVEKWEDMPDEPVSLEGSGAVQADEQSRLLSNGLTQTPLAVERPEALWAEQSECITVSLDESVADQSTAPSLAAPKSILDNSSTGGLVSTTSALMGAPEKQQPAVIHADKKTSKRYEAACRRVEQAIRSAIPPPAPAQPRPPQTKDEEDIDMKPSFVPSNARKSENKPLGATQIPPEEETRHQRPTKAEEDADMSADVIIVSEESKKAKQKKRALSSSTAGEGSAEQNNTAGSSKKNKKRKSNKGKEAESGANGETPDKPPASKPFDYSQEASILDAKPTAGAPAPQSSSKKDKKKEKEQSKERKEKKPFKVAPKDRLNVSSGGMSRTF